MVAVEIVGLLSAFSVFVFQAAFTYPSAQIIVGVEPSFFRAVFFEDFGFNRLVVQIVEVVLYFAVGQFAVDQVAGAVVVIGRAVVGFKAVEYVVGKAVARTVFICNS